MSRTRKSKGCGPPSVLKRIWNRIDRRRAKRETKKEEPQIPRSHRHWGTWDWF